MPRAEGKTAAKKAATAKAPSRAAATKPAAAKPTVEHPVAEKPTVTKPTVTQPEVAKAPVAKAAVEKAAPTKPAAKHPAAGPALSPELAAARVALVAELARLSSERESLQAGLDEVIRDSAAGSGDDQADSGAKTFGREQEQGLLNRVAEALDQTERALARVDAGTYGICESCGAQIGAARLEAYPRATLCVSCKQREERR